MTWIGSISFSCWNNEKSQNKFLMTLGECAHCVPYFNVSSHFEYFNSLDTIHTSIDIWLFFFSALSLPHSCLTNQFEIHYSCISYWITRFHEIECQQFDRKIKIVSCHARKAIQFFLHSFFSKKWTMKIFSETKCWSTYIQCTLNKSNAKLTKKAIYTCTYTHKQKWQQQPQGKKSMEKI